VRFWTAEDDARLRAEYEAAVTNGRLGGLAADMGRTKPFVCR
jgi:hypothetical protein